MTHLIGADNLPDPIVTMVAIDVAGFVLLLLLVVLARLYTVRRDRAEGDA